VAKGFKIADAYVEVETRFDNDSISKGLAAAVEKDRTGIDRTGRDIGRRVGDAAGDHTGRSMISRLRRDRTKNTQGMTSALYHPLAFGQGLFKALSLGMANFSLAKAFTKSPQFVATGIAIGAAMATTIAAGLAATLTAALAGGVGLSFIGLGAFLLKDEPEVKRAGTRLGNTFKDTFKRAAGAMLMPLVGSMEIFRQTIERMQPTIDRIFRTLSPAILPLAEGLAGFLEALGPGLEDLAWVGAQVLEDLGRNLPGWGKSLGDFFTKIRDNWPEIKDSLEEFFSDLGKALGALAAAFLWLSRNYTNLRNKLIFLAEAVQPILFIWKKVGALWRLHWNELVANVRQKVDQVVTILKSLLPRSWGALGGLWPRIRQAFRTATTGMRINALGMVSGFVNILATIIPKAYAKMLALRSRIVGFFGNAGGWLFRAGSNLIGGLVAGMSSRMGALWGKVQEVKNAVTEFLSNAWKLQSPSRVTMGMGENLIRGLEIGIDKRKLPLKRQMTGVAAGIPRAINNAAPRSIASTSNSTFNINVVVRADGTFGRAQAEKVGRETAIAIRDALDVLDRSRR